MTTRWPTPRVTGYAALAVLGLVAALVLGRPEPALLAAPFGLFLAVGLAFAGPPARLVASVGLARDRVVEGDEAELRIRLAGAGGEPAGDVELRTVLPPGVGAGPVRLDGATLVQGLVVPRWGAYRVGSLAVRTTDPLRLFFTETTFDFRTTLRVYPSPGTLRSAVAAAELQRRVGNHTSRSRGDGIEFSDIRPFAPGDRARAVNWRATARRGALWVDDRRPERSADVVLLLDTFTDATSSRAGARRVAALELAVRVLAALADGTYAQRDRVGLLTFGGHLRWIAPGLGQRALLRVVDGLLDTEVLLSATWEGVNRVPIGALPAKALLLAVTPLDNDTGVQTLLDLRARGFDAAVVVVPEPAAPGDPPLARRLTALQRNARRLRLERLGVTVGEAPTLDDLPLAVEEVQQFRRRQPRGRA